MLIDPFTTIAQIINFLILVVLLKKFLYHPIIEAMEQREKRIALRFQEATDQVNLAQQEAEHYLQQQEELQKQRGKLLREAQLEADARKELLIRQLKAEVEAKQNQWYEALNRDREALVKEFRQKASQKLMSMARRALEDLANADLEQQIITNFIDRLENIDSISLLNNSEESIVICSSFPITPENQTKLIQVLETILNQKPVNVSWKITPDVLCGIELRTQSYKIAWNLGHYLDQLEAEIRRSLTEFERKPN
jgi:F-type H+-transporting ATPase subunit b